jgi:hypothetical protein
MDEKLKSFFGSECVFSAEGPVMSAEFILSDSELLIQSDVATPFAGEKGGNSQMEMDTKPSTIWKRLADFARIPSKSSKRYNVVIPEDLYQQLQEAADRRGISYSELLRRFIKLGLIATWIEELPDAALIVREGDTEKELLLI